MIKVNKEILWSALKRGGVSDHDTWRLGITPRKMTLKAMAAECRTIGGADGVSVLEDAMYRVQLARAFQRCGGSIALAKVEWVLHGDESAFELTQGLIDLCATVHGEAEDAPEAWDHVFSGTGERPYKPSGSEVERVAETAKAPDVARATARCWSCHAHTDVGHLHEWTGHQGDLRLVCEACLCNTGRINLPMTDLLSSVFSAGKEENGHG